MTCIENCAETMKDAIAEALRKFIENGDRGQLSDAIDAARDAFYDCVDACNNK